MPQSAGLIFTNDSGAGSGTSSYVIDTLPDYTFAANSNTGFSSTVSNNPLNLSYGNTDLPQYGSKYLAIKDLVLVQDRSQWISGKQTYQVIFYENFPQIKCFVFGNVQLNRYGQQASVLVKTIGDGISVSGVIRQVGFNLQPNSAATATAQVVVDNANEGTSIDFSSQTSSVIPNVQAAAYNVYLHNSTKEAYGLHDIRLTANQASTMAVNGIVVYFENTGLNIDQLPGTSYINKNKVTTASAATLAIPSFGSSLGGNALVYKTQLAGYTISALSATTIASTASGSSGTNLLSFSVGTGASFIAGYGVIVSQGSSTYIGSIVSMSTDTATMGNTLGFGISATSNVYTAWKAGNTLAINASLMTMAYSLDFSKLNATNGFSSTLFDATNKYAFWGNNIGLTQIDGNQCAVFLGASGFMQMDGYFSAAEIETLGNGIWGATVSVNGFGSWSQQAGQTGTVKKTVFTDAGPGWNSFNLGVAASMGLCGIQRINMYTRNKDIGVSYGFLADYDFCQTFTNRDAINASMMALGGIQRVYADQIYFKNTWLRGQTWTVPGGVYYQGASTNGSFTFQYYGQQFGVVGTFNTGGTLTLDGAGVGLTANIMQSVATLGFHTVTYTGGTAVVSAIDYVLPYRSKVDAKISPISLGQTLTLLPPTTQTFFGGTGTYSVPQYPKPLWLKVKMVGGGGGGGGAGTSQGSTAGAGGLSYFGTSMIAASGGGLGPWGGAITTGGAGGTGIIISPIGGLSMAGGYGGGGTSNTALNAGGAGGNSFLGGAANGQASAGGSANAAVNSGSGGSGGSGSGGGVSNGGGGGGGGYVEAIIPVSSLATSFPYAVGAAGAAGGAGGGGAAGGAGGAGIIIVEEYYQ
jgi:hypothetical protein